MRKATLLFLFALAHSSLAGATEIYYPGTFDPFHRTHLAEVNAAREHAPGATLVLLPVEDGVYNRRNGVPLPRLFSYGDSVALLKATFKEQPAVVDESLRQVTGDPLQTILAAIRQHPDPDKILVAGVDTLEKWRTLPGFKDLLRETRLFVGEDKRTPELTRRLKEIFRDDSRIRFFDVPGVPLRSADINQRILMSSDKVFDQLPSPFARELNEHPEKMAARIDAFIQQHIRYTAEILKDELLPLLEKKGLLIEGDDRDGFALELADNVIRREREPRGISKYRREAVIAALEPSALETLPSARSIQFSRNAYLNSRVGLDRMAMRTRDGLAEFEIRPTSADTAELWVKNQRKWKLDAKLVRMRGDVPLFHWNSSSNSSGWWEDRRIDPDNLAWRRINTIESNVAGGGFYVSSSASDSAGFGGQLTVVEPKKEFWTAIQESHDDRISAERNRLFRQAGISAIKVSTAKDFDWYNIIDENLLKNARKGTIADISAHATAKADLLPLEYWLERAANEPETDLKNLAPPGSLMGRVLNSPAAPKGFDLTNLKFILRNFFSDPMTEKTYAGNRLLKHLANADSEVIQKVLGQAPVNRVAEERRRAIHFGHSMLCERVF